MKKAVIIACNLLCVLPTVTHTKITPIKLEASMLKAFDGNVINWKAVRFINGYKKKLKQFMHKPYMVLNENKTLFNLMQLEDKQSLPDNVRDMFFAIRQDFISFSEPFLNYLQTVKSGLVVLIEEDCQRRNRLDSTLLKWAHIGIGEERALFTKQITSYRSLCAFCVDVLYFLEDLLLSCPKACQSYEQEMERCRAIHRYTDELLKNDAVTLSKTHYNELLQKITAEHASMHVTQASVASLYKLFIHTLSA